VICATAAFSYASELESNATDTGKVSEAGRLSWECLA
jgi:hypothetical protein